MSKNKLFDDDSDEEVALETKNEYAKKYDSWREKEEMHKLEQKYGAKALNSDASLSSDSEDESDEPPEVSEETEKQFLKTLALLKTKDPRIYDTNYKFFDDEKEEQAEKESKPKGLTFDDSDDEDDDGGNIFSIEKKADVEMEQDNDGKKNKKEGKLKEFLTGQVEHIGDEVEKDLEPLKALWSDPKLSEGEAFLRDYILNKKYLEDDDAAAVTDKLRDDEDLEADEKMVEEQGKFERAYNFRFEEPDEEYLKRFPRTMNYIRPKDERRARKRAEARARKESEKKRKMEDIARLKALKLKEIKEKIAKIKEVTGNDELAFKEEDIEGDFDPEEHDRRMRAIFDEEYYGDADDQKPVFPDLDEELEIENWENYEPEVGECDDNDGPHCEDEDFNMDADYDPKQARTNLMEEIQKSLGKKRRNRKKKSKLGQLLTIDKPKFVPTIANKTYNEYMEEYYKMDCEDIIGGDLPTRFKYREVVPNDYGLTIEEILLADDKELTQWVPLKKIVRHRPENVEKGEVKTYAQKAQDLRLKKKVLPSLFKDLPEEPEIVVPIEEASKKKKKKKKKNKDNDMNEAQNDNVEATADDGDETATTDGIKNKKKHKESKKIKEDDTDVDIDGNVTEVNSAEYSSNESQIDSKKKKNKHKNTGESTSQDRINDSLEVNSVDNSRNESQLLESSKKKKKHKKHKSGIEVDTEIKTKVTDLNDSVINENVSNENNKRKEKVKEQKNSFVVEHINNVAPSQGDVATSNAKPKNNEANIESNNRKRKLDSNADQVPNKKRKNKRKKQFDKNDGNNRKEFNKFKNDKFRNKTKKDDDPSNPLSKLSDERLKAYGLNPKKYRGFLKYKKF
ncbi:protein KRI1 homolog [Amyelois transitella]|uniref:protein KRI1 homolog n=1 Tax=Amyelois transitella TaxID=680683 RepID=UPI0029903BA6|nr:protein KRI1 homolog [Amyelois transitella]